MGKKEPFQKDNIQNRKVNERREREALKKQKNKDDWGLNDQEMERFTNQLQIIGLCLKDVKGDGNCLFRALGDQLNGDEENHAEYREGTVSYIASHRTEFEPFLGEEEGKNFEDAVSKLSKLGTYAGNWALIAFSRQYKVNINIHQLDQVCWKILCDGFGVRELHVAYFGYEHYSSIRNIDGSQAGPAFVQIKRDVNSIQSNKGIDWYEKQVMDATGCTDIQTIRLLLENHEHNYNLVTDLLLEEKEQFEMEMKMVEESLQSFEIDNKNDNQNRQSKEKPKEQQKLRNLSNRERKELAKKEKKERRNQEKQEEARLKQTELSRDVGASIDLSRQILI